MSKAATRDLRGVLFRLLNARKSAMKGQANAAQVRLLRDAYAAGGHPLLDDLSGPGTVAAELSRRALDVPGRDVTPEGRTTADSPAALEPHLGVMPAPAPAPESASPAPSMQDELFVSRSPVPEIALKSEGEHISPRPSFSSPSILSPGSSLPPGPPPNNDHVLPEDFSGASPCDESPAPSTVLSDVVGSPGRKTRASEPPAAILGAAAHAAHAVAAEPKSSVLSSTQSSLTARHASRRLRRLIAEDEEGVTWSVVDSCS